MAIAAGGINILNTEFAKDYGNSLLKAGFTALPSSSNPEKGDVVVIQPYPGSRLQAGHMAMFDGKTWYSDFKQKDLYPGNGYRRNHLRYLQEELMRLILTFILAFAFCQCKCTR
jgi:hypothetical protein